MCDVLPGYSCDQAPIDTNVVSGYDEFYRYDQTHVPTTYLSACAGEGCVDTGCGVAPECGEEQCGVIEDFRGGRRRHRRRHFGRRGYWGGYWPWYDTWAYRQPIVIKQPAPAPQNDLSKWLLPIGVAVALLFVAKR